MRQTAEQKSEKKRLYNAEYRAKNSEKIAAKHLEWRLANPEHVKAKADERYTLHGEEMRAAARLNDHAKRAADPEGERVKVRARYAKNPGPTLERCWAARAAKFGDPVNDFTYAQFEEIVSSQEHQCAYCPDDCIPCEQKAHSLHADHITPLAKHGPNTLHNVVAVCKQCNFNKHRHVAPRFVQPLLLTIAPSQKHHIQKAA